MQGMYEEDVEDLKESVLRAAADRRDRHAGSVTVQTAESMLEW